MRIFRDTTDSTPDGGNLTFNLRVNGSSIATSPLSIPTTGATTQFVEFISDFSVIASGSSYELIFELVNPDSAEKRFEAEMFLEQVFL